MRTWRSYRTTAGSHGPPVTASHPDALRLTLLLLVVLVVPDRASTQETPAQEVPGGDFHRLAEAAGSRSGGAFPFDYQHLVYAVPGREEVDVWGAVSVHAGRVREVFEAGWKYALRLRFELYDGDQLVASDTARAEHVLNRPVPETTTDGFPLQARLRVRPGVYRYRMEVVDLNWTSPPSVNEVTGEVHVPSLHRSRPAVSSIAIAADSGGSWEPAEGVRLKLNAARIVRKESRPYVYYEVYGITPRAPFRGEVKLLSTWASRGRGEDFRGSYRPFQLQYHGTAPADPALPVRSALRLDLSRTEPGPYQVTVQITDLATGQTSEVRRAELKVRADRPRGPPVKIEEVGSANAGL